MKYYNRGGKRWVEIDMAVAVIAGLAFAFGVLLLFVK